MGGLSFCFSNEPCIRKGTDFEWETDRRSAYQAEPVPFLIWGECPTARGHRPRAARRPPRSFFLPPGKPLRQAGKARGAAAGRPVSQSTTTSARGQRPRAARRPPRFFPIPPGKTPAASGQSPRSRSREANSQAATATTPSSPYASTTISSFVSRAVCTSPSIFSSRFFSCLRITFRFGLVTGCFATKIVQQSSYGRIDVS